MEFSTFIKKPIVLLLIYSFIGIIVCWFLFGPILDLGDTVIGVTEALETIDGEEVLVSTDKLLRENFLLTNLIVFTIILIIPIILAAITSDKKSQ